MREQVAPKKLEIRFIHSGDQVADKFTKALSVPLLERFRDNLNLQGGNSDDQIADGFTKALSVRLLEGFRDNLNLQGGLRLAGSVSDISLLECVFRYHVKISCTQC